MELRDILNHKLAEVARTLPDRAEKKMHGHMNVSFNGCVLYLVKKILGEDCKSFLNIGVQHGGSMIVAMATRSPCVHVGIDAFDRVEESINVTRDQAELNINYDNPFNQEYSLIHGNPNNKSVLAQVAELCPEVDLLFIDGKRSKSQTRRDLTYYRSRQPEPAVVIVDGYADELKPGRFLSRKWKTIGLVGDTLILERK